VTVGRVRDSIALVAISVFLIGAPLTSMAADDALELRLKHLETELRCLVCQNQTLAESNAPLAEDLRREVRELAVAGKSDEDIRAYLVARYGDFVLYKPPVKPVTYALWFGPFLLLAGGVVIWIVMLRRRSRAASREVATSNDSNVLPPGALSKARALLEDERAV
jgi:cytochrome c-type biogenesis protein CcmH